MNKKLLTLIALFIATYTFSQNILMQNGTANACSGTFSDSGFNGIYSANEDFTLTICADVANNLVLLNFTSFATETGQDVLTIYDGDDTTAAVIGTFSGGLTAALQDIRASETSPTGCLTLKFQSNGSANGPGWLANVSCKAPCQTITANIDSTTPAANTTGVISIAMGASVTFDGSATFSDSGTGATYSWDFGDGNTGTGETVSHTFNTDGVFDVEFTVTDSESCTSTTQTIQVIVQGPYIRSNDLTDPQSSFTPEELLNDVLVNSPCADIEIIDTQTWGNANATNNNRSYGYFNKGNAVNFPFEEGIILSTGRARRAEGPNNGGSTSSGFNGPTGFGEAGDLDLKTLIDLQRGGDNDVYDASFFEFKFTPEISNFSFNFFFASEEYENNSVDWECTAFIDGFAFLLKGPGIPNDSGTPFGGTNIAKIPNTDVFINAFTIASSNVGCSGHVSSSPPQPTDTYFPHLYVSNWGTNNNDEMAFDGRSVVMQAAATVTPGQEYTMKIVIGDSQDNTLDSAIFLEANSFKISPELGEDRTVCSGDTVILDTGAAAGIDHDWFLDGGEIVGENGPTLTATQSGTYSVTNACGVDDEVVITFAAGASINNVEDLTVCDNGAASFVFDLTENDSEVLGTQNAADYTITYHNNQADATADTNPITNPTMYSGTDGEVVFVRFEPNNTGTCGPSTDSFTLNVANVNANDITIQQCSTTVNLENQIPSILDAGVDATTVNVTFYDSQANADAETNPITNTTSYTATNNEVIFVRVESIDGNCFDTSTITIQITPPTISSATNMELCDDFPNDDQASFTLTDQDAQVLGTLSASNYDVTYYTSLANATSGTSSLVSPYTNTANPQDIYVRIQDANDATCFSISPLPVFQLIVNASDNPTFSYAAACGGGTATIATSGVSGTFDFTIVQTDGAVIDTTNGEITNGVAGTTYTVEFTTSGTCPSTSTQSVTALTTADTSFTLTPSCNGATANVTGNTGGTFSFETPPVAPDTAAINPNDGSITGGLNDTTYSVTYSISGTCGSSTTVDVTTLTKPTTIQPTALEVCDDNVPDGFTSINLNVKNSEISGGNPDYAVTYYLTQADADNEVNPLAIPYTNISNPQTIFSRVEDINTGCFSTVTLELVVEQAPVANTPLPLEYCDADADGFGEFDLQSTANDITGGAAGITVSYHETMADAENNVNPITANPYLNIVANMQTIYVRVESATIATDCASFVELQLIVYPSPQILDVPTDLEICDDATADGITVIDLTVNEDLILDGLPAADYNITYYTSEANANAGNNPITPATAYTNTTAFNQTVWVRVEDNPTVTATNDGCYTVVAMNIIVNPLPVLVQPDPLELCDYNNPGDEVEEFTLEGANAQILAGQTGISLTYFSTQIAADTNDSALEIFSPYANTANAQTVYVRAENDDTGCINTITLDLRVNPLPSPVANPTPLVACDGDNDGLYDDFDLDSQTTIILGGELNVSLSYHETFENAEDGSMPLSSPYLNIVPYNQTIYVTAINDITGCYTIVELELQVLDAPVIPIVVMPLDANPTDNIYVVCDDDNDGFNVFDFDTAVTPVVLGTQDPAAYPISYYTTLADAEASTNPIINTSNYANAANPQTIWVRLDSANGCETIRSFEISVEAPPVVTTPSALEVCDDLDADYYEDNDGLTIIDLTVKDSEIIAGNASWIVTYHETQANAISGTQDIPDATMYSNTTPGAQTIWVRVVDADTGCFSVTTLTIRVLPNPSPSQDPSDIELCDYDNSPDGIEIFDLTVNETYILNGEGTAGDPRHVSYYTDLNDALTATTPIADPTMHSNEDPDNLGTGISPQTIYVRVTNGTDEVGAGGTGCYTIVSFDVIVNPLPIIPADDLNIYACELMTDNIYNFDLTVNTPTILAAQGDVNYTITYHETQIAADAGTPQIGTPSNYQNLLANPQEIFVNITNTTTGCVNTLSFFIEVNEAAQAFAYANPYEVCDDNMEFDNDPSNDSSTFDLTTQDAEVLGTQPAANYTVSYYLTQAEADAGDPATALTSPFTNTINTQEIIVRVDNDTPSDISLDLTTITLPAGLDFNADGTIDTYDTDGDGVVDLIDVDGDGISDAFDTDANPNTVEGIDLDADGLADLVDIDGDGVVDNQDSSFCYATTELTLQVNPLPAFDLDANYMICANTNGSEVIQSPTITTGLNPADYTFVWFVDNVEIAGQTGPSIIPVVGGNYVVEVTDISTSTVTMCSSSDSTLVEVSQPPVIVATVTTEAFADVHNIEVTTTNTSASTYDVSVYEFSLDGGAFVSNTPNTNTYTFTDVGAGEHIITVRDINGCGESSKPVTIMDYPLYFTPNGDGYNDTWNIYGIANQPDATIMIFDRFGKLLKQISPTSGGWDGTYNGNPMPTSDYWFTVEYREPNSDSDEKKQFRAHFTLKR